MGFVLRRFVATAGLVWLMTAAAYGQEQAGQPKQKRMPKKTIEAVLKEHTDRLMSIPGVMGTAQGECKGQPCMKVYVVKKTPDLLKQIPSSLEGYKVVIQETGQIRALDPS